MNKHSGFEALDPVDMSGHSIKNFPFLAPRTGTFVTGTMVSSRISGAMTANKLYGLPFLVKQDCQITAARVVVDTTGGAGNGRLGIYKSSNLDRLDEPGALVADWGVVSAAAPGIKTISPLATDLTPGWHYLAMVVDNAVPTWFKVAGSAIVGLMDDLAGVPSYGWIATHVYGPLPDPFPAASVSGTVPIIGISIGSYS